MLLNLEWQLKWLNVISSARPQKRKSQKVPLILSKTPYQNILYWLQNDS